MVPILTALPPNLLYPERKSGEDGRKEGDDEETRPLLPWEKMLEDCEDIEEDRRGLASFVVVVVRL